MINEVRVLTGHCHRDSIGRNEKPTAVIDKKALRLPPTDSTADASRVGENLNS